ncbi:putative MIOREX complex component [Clavispora lusitaniae]|uniref:MIOREX complex component n=1 Tax=Clavispora lusitaniae TaxID=36911 RepID=A0ACD0WJE6_CLALS|nr:putative MIOREX complex component [Clavispora lusitaniae]QFZ33337.1 putative MIOREX complex component [Clavispora lusitaniae]QFZ39008.1 putative MIOREX complex component [Clavispora lusitaniae]QFZ44690.1 putative MIOREX complex component [Clavispora lusitaniae]QFZ50367.1 putative MIOREX complex component [Clavispora lusitaniae]
MLPSRRHLVPASHIKARLEHFVETGEVRRWSDRQQARKLEHAAEKRRAAVSRNKPSLQKTLLLLQAKYDAVPLQTPQGVLDLQRLTAKDLRVDSAKSLSIFRALVGFNSARPTKAAETAGSPGSSKTAAALPRPPSRLLLALLGSSPDQIKDPYVVTRDVLKLLARDNDPLRAMHLCRLAGPNATAGLNAVIEWCLDRSDVDRAHRCLANAARWRIPTSTHTYVHYFGGLARCHEWGKVPDDLVARTLRLLDRLDAVPLEVFNAALSLVAKCFSANQQAMVDLLEHAGDRGVAPSAHTYTIFLNGARHLHRSRADAIRADTSLSAPVRTRRLFEAHARLVQTANMVMGRVVAGATPPVPPSKAAAEADPSLLAEYRKQCRRVLVDVDPVFAATFLQCYVNGAAGTAQNPRSGAHYRYLQQALVYLEAWSPEVAAMLRFAHAEAPFEPAAAVRAKVDARLASAPEATAYSPHNLTPLAREDINPMVIFPPPAFSSNKTRAVFSGKKKPLVDFGRPTFADIHKAVLNRTFETSKGKFGKKLPRSQQVSLERRPGVNKFLLHLALDALVKLGRHAEFYRAMWYALSTWGGLYVDKTRLGSQLACQAVPATEYPEIPHARKSREAKRIETTEKSTEESTEKSTEKSDGASTAEPSNQESKPSLNEKLRSSSTHDNSILDTMLVENFIHKMEECFPHSAVPARFAAELVAALVSHNINMARTLQPREKTFDAVFALLNRDVYLYNDKNWHQGTVGNRRRDVPNNTPKRSLTEAQLQDILDPLLVLIRSIIVHEGRLYAHVANRKSLMSNRFVESYISLVNKLYDFTWTDAPDNSTAAITIHKKILAGGIFFYRPQALVDPRDKIVYAENVRQSMEFLYKTLKDKSDLSSGDKRLMHALRSLFTMDTQAPEAVAKLKGLQSKIYDLCR